MKRLINATLCLLLIGSVIWSCEGERKNLLLDDGISLAKSSDELPKVVFLEQPYPNPIFLNQNGASCTVVFGLPQARRVTLTVENIVGDGVRTLLNQELVAGVHSVKWNAKNNGGKSVIAGVYMVHLETAPVSLRRLIEIRE